MTLDDFDPEGGPAPLEHIFTLPHGPERARVVVVPVPFEATTTYGHGTGRGPRRMLAASHQVDLRDDWAGEPWREGIAMLPIPEHIEALDRRASALVRAREVEGPPVGEADRAMVAEVDACGAEVNRWLYDEVSRLFEQGRLPGVVGGDHSISFGAIRAATERHRGLGLLHIDAHADLREAYEGYAWSHASIIYNVWTKLDGIASIVSVGLRDYSPVEARRLDEHSIFHPFPDRAIVEWELGGRPFVELVDRMIAPLPENVWITFDVDGLDPSLCPNTGTPVPGGLSFGHVNVLLNRLAASRRIVGFDLTEVGDGEWDGNVGARLLYKLAGYAVATNPRP